MVNCDIDSWLQDGLSVAPAIRAYGGNQTRSPAEMALAAARVDGRVTVLDFVSGTNCDDGLKWGMKHSG